MARVLSKEKIKEHYGADAIEKLKIQGVINLHTSGIKPNDHYTLYQVNTLLEKKKLGVFAANQKGQLQEVREGVPLSGFNLFLFNLMNGESIYYALESASKKRCFVTQVTIDPIEYTWADGAYLNVLLTSVDATQFMIVAKDFRPNEELAITSTSGKETITSVAKANNTGKLVSIAMPGVKGMSGGAATLSIERKATNNTGTLSYLWGTSAIAKPQKN